MKFYKPKMNKYLNIGIKSNYGTVKYLQFGIASPTEILQQSVCEIDSTGLRNYAQAGTVYDPRMGVLGNNKECQTCGNDTIVCPGHFGHITLEEPVIHPKYFKTILSILKCVCHTCSACLVTKDQAELLGLLKFKLHRRFKEMTEKCVKVELCPRCEDPSPIYTTKDNKIKMTYNKNKTAIELTTREIYEILTKISNDDYTLMGFNQQLSNNEKFKKEKILIDDDVIHRHQSRPEWLIFTVLPVLPPVARPYSFRDGEQHDDDLTDKYVSIVKANQKLRDDKANKHLEQTKGRKRTKLTEKERKKIVYELEEHIRTLIDNSDEKSKISGGRAHKGIKERISSKEGHMRKNIMGKRVDFSARTVIGGGAMLETNQLEVPIEIAEKLTRPEFVHSGNIAKLQKLVNEKKANIVFRNGNQILLKFATKQWTKEFQLQPNDVVERHLQDDDWLLFNRQPTLRIESMMGLRVKVTPHGQTFRFNLAATKAFNADYDGDEMNAHLPQSYGAQAELQVLMDANSHIISAQNNAPVIGMVQDGLLGPFILTDGKTKVSRMTFMDCLMGLKLDFDLQEFYKRASKFYPKDFLKKNGSLKLKSEISGKLLFSILFPSNFSYEKKTDIDENFPIVMIEKGIMKPQSGPICKKTIGAVGNSIIHMLCKEYSNSLASDFISNVQFLTNRWFPTHGFSVGISDCLIENWDEVKQTLEKTHVECQEKIDIGSEFLEREINGILNSATNVGQKLSKNGLADKNNRLVIMQKSGAKGNHVNCSQITALVGQQNVRGQRIPKTLSDSSRCLPYFEPKDDSPSARGFIDKAYLEGLTPQQTFFLAQGGREGLVDTAIKTAQSGYIQRKIVKKTEDLKGGYDGTVRASNGSILQFLYGSDGYDASKLYYVSGKPFFIDPCRVAKMLSIGKKTVKLTSSEIEEICCQISVNGIESECTQNATKQIRNTLRSELEKVEIAKSSIEQFSKKIKDSFYRSLMEGGEMVGIVAASSVGEPTTQATLNTFHFSGQSGKDVTLGVPRLQECLDATKNPKTPSCVVYLNDEMLKKCENDAQSLLRVQQLRKHFQYTMVSDLFSEKPKLRYIEADSPGFSPIKFYKYYPYKPEWWVKLYKELFGNPTIKEKDWVVQLTFDIEKLFMIDMTLKDIAKIIESDTSFGTMSCIPSPNNIGKIDVYIDFDSAIEPAIEKVGLETENDIQLITSDNVNFYYTRDIVLKKIGDIKVCGIEGISKIFPKKIDADWVIDTQGCNFVKVLNSPQCDFSKTTCDDFWQIYKTLGIEAVREVLIDELTKCLSFDGSYINPRHISLLVDTMTTTGTITSVRREGIDRSVGPLAKCAFEKTLDNFALASMFCEKETVSGVSASITLGKIGTMGTGACDIIPDKDYLEDEIEIIKRNEKQTMMRNIMENY